MKEASEEGICRNVMQNAKLICMYYIYVLHIYINIYIYIYIYIYI